MTLAGSGDRKMLLSAEAGRWWGIVNRSSNVLGQMAEASTLGDPLTGADDTTALLPVASSGVITPAVASLVCSFS